MRNVQNLSVAAITVLILLCITVLPSSVSGVEVIILEPTDDCEICMRNPDDNYGSSGIMHIRNRFGHPSHPTNWENDILIKFDLSSIPQSSPIISATLYIYYFYWTSNNPAGRELDLYRVTSDWDESTVTWNTQPTTEFLPTSYSIVPATAHSWMTWDVTSDVQASVDGQAINYGWKIMDTTTWGDFDIPYAGCRTKEYDSCHPYLVVEYKADSLIIPSVTVNPCDGDTLVQPVAVKLKEPLLSACIPIEIPDGVQFCDISTEGLITDGWSVYPYWNQDSSAFAAMMLPPGGLGDTLWDDTDSIVVFNILFSVQRDCITSYYICWDTAFSDDPAHQLVFTDTLGGARSPGFDPYRDSTEILGCNDSLIIPSVMVAPCDSCWGGAIPTVGVQPVAVKLKVPLLSACIPIEIPDAVQFCDISTEGLITEDWTVFLFWNEDSSAFAALMTPPGGLGDTLWDDTDSIVVFNILFSVQRDCITSYYICWDTAFSDDPAHQLVFTDTLGGARSPGFDPYRDSTEILGYTPGDCTNDGAVDISDLVCMVDFMFTGGPPPCVMDAIDVNGDCEVDISDLVYLVDYMFNEGPAPVCGNISAGSVGKATAHPQIVVAAKVDNGVTTILLAAPFDLRGLDLQLAGPDGASPVKLVGDALDMVYGQEGERVKIGILDLDGANVIPAGENRVIQIAGEYEVVSAVVATDGYHTYVATIGEAAKGGSLPSDYALGQNYPNPFNPVTTISFSLPVASHVTLEVYNVMGQRVTTVSDGFYEAGVHACGWNGSAVASGVYFYRIETPEFVETKKMMLLK